MGHKFPWSKQVTWPSLMTLQQEKYISSPRSIIQKRLFLRGPIERGQWRTKSNNTAYCKRLSGDSVKSVLVSQSCLTLCNPMDGSPPGSSVHGILQARILERAVISFSRGSSWPRDQSHISCIDWQVGSFPLSHFGSPVLYQYRVTCEFSFFLSLGKLFSTIGLNVGLSRLFFFF